MKKLTILMGVTMIIASCATKNPVLPPGDLDAGLEIAAVPSTLGNEYTSNFNRYTKVVTPNGEAIHIVAQSNITNEQIIRCRSILEHYLNNFPNSVYGSDKSAIANKMAENGAILTLLNGQDDGSNPVEVNGQPLYENEIQVEGGAWYTHQDYGHRDAAYEEILHLVHDYGIGVDGPNSLPGGGSEFQIQIRAAQQHALNNGLWGIGTSDWIEELGRENSLSQEYLAAVVDSYYGLWGAWTENPTHGMWGIYVAKSREDMGMDDPMGKRLIDRTFFHPYLTYNARIDPDFSGTFSLRFDEALPYTHHAQYLRDITLLGTRGTNVRVNGMDNDITGNEGENVILFTGDENEYTITTASGVFTITDKIVNRDGTNTVRNVEKLQFADGTITL